MHAEWDAVTRAHTLRPEVCAVRHELAEAARCFDWPRVLTIVGRQPLLANATRLDGQSWFAPLHQMAFGGAPVHLAERLIELGAWRTLRTRAGERAVDVAKQRGHGHLVPVLRPVLRREVPPQRLSRIQGHFHDLIRARAGPLVTDHALRLPELETLLELDQPCMWMSIPGMYGGFRFSLQGEGDLAVLVTESWSRVVEGSEHRHLISPHGTLLLWPVQDPSTCSRG